jgi:hypothetical protein
MEHEAAKTPVPAPPVVVATPEAAGGAPLGVQQMLSLQRTAGNQAVCRAIAAGLIQRDDAQPAAGGLTGVVVTPGKSSVPAEAGVTITARAQGGTGTYSLAAGTATPASGTTIDATSGRVTLDAKQPGGTLKAKATAADGSWAEQEFAVVEKPTAIASTSGSATGDYEAAFTHTFSAASGNAAGLQGENINEKFDSLSVPSPFGGNFTLTANAAGSPGWDLDASGAMAGPDNVSIGAAGIDAQPFVVSASNPTPAKTLPQGFAMAQHLHAKSFPSGRLDASPFTTTDHVRTLAEENGKLVFKIKAGVKEVSMPYTGPAVYRNAKVDQATVPASLPKPAKPSTVQVSVSAEGSGASPAYSIVGADLGCAVDASGKVTIGTQAGTITVRAGEAKRYDEVKITITPAPSPATGKPMDAGDAAAPVPAAVTP